MNTSDFLDALMTHSEEVSTSDGNYTTIRARNLLRAQQAVEFLWNYDDWDFKQKIGGTLTLTSGAYSAVAPSGFYQIGSNGSVWISGQPIEVFRLDAPVVAKLRRARAGAQTMPSYYCVTGQDASTHRPTFIFDAIADTTYTLDIDYELTRPTLVDSAIAGSNGLDQVPDEHVRSVLLPAVIELSGSDQGDGRVTTELGPRAMATLKQMKAHRDQSRPADGRLGDFGLRLWQMH